MNAQSLAALLEYFDLKQFFANNPPLRLAIIFGILLILWAGAYFLANLAQKKLEKFVAERENSASKSAADDSPAHKMDFSLFERVVKNTRRLINLAILYWGLSRLVVGPLYAEAVRILFTTLCIWAAIEFFIAFVPFNIDLYMRRHGSTLQTSSSRSFMPIIKGIIWAIGLTTLLDNLGFHVSTIIAGLGIVGVAVGLAGQAILADFFSYIVILLDKPFQIGDFVELGDGKSGDVEYMGPKTTHLRNLNDDLIVCANSEMTKGVLLNQGSIRDRVVIMTIGVDYTTPPTVLRRLPDILRQIVESVPKCRFDRACLLNFGPSNLQYQLLYFVADKKADIRDFMNTRSEVNIAILEEFAREGINMAYPTEHVLLTELPAPEKSVQPQQKAAV